MEKTSTSLSRQSSINNPRRSSPVLYLFLSPYFKKFLCVGLFFSCGMIAGVFLREYVLDGISSRSIFYQHNRPNNDVSKQISHELQRDEGRPGLSIKKDLSIQFRDYLPRRIFINTAENVPYSLDLFLQTYPDAHKYHVYTFLADKAYSPLYTKYSNHVLFSGASFSSSESIIMMDFAVSLGDYNRKKVNSSVALVDMLTWLQDNVHVDDYVVVKLSTDPENEKRIAERLTSFTSPDWIDKLYTTTTEDNLFYFIREQFQVYGHHVYRWNDDLLTYSDFEVINPSKFSPKDGILVKEACGDKNKTQFTAFLYAPHVQFSLNGTLSLLHIMSEKIKGQLPVTLFLPPAYFESTTMCQQLSRLQKSVEIGLYLQETLFHITETMNLERQQNLVRNFLVSVEHCFEQSNLTLKFVLPSSAFISQEKERSKLKSKSINKVKQVLKERFYTIVNNVQDVEPSAIIKGEHSFWQDFGNSINNRLIALDVTRPGCDTAVLSLLSAHVSSIIPLNACAKLQHESNPMFYPL